jgi:hypothetical protein
MKNKILLLLVIGLMLIPLTACVPAVTPAATFAPTATTQPTETPTKPAASFPTGKFVKSGTENYWLIFNEDQTFSVSHGSTTIVSGTYSVDGDIFTDETNSQNCPPMKFRYTFDGTNLTFNYVGDPADDPCDGRRADFNNVTYILSK